MANLAKTGDFEISAQTSLNFYLISAKTSLNFSDDVQSRVLHMCQTIWSLVITTLSAHILV